MKVTAIFKSITTLLAAYLLTTGATVNGDTHPNSLVILADDLGYSDSGAYGSEISTPNLNQLAQEGLRLSQYYTSASCAPTRAMLFDLAIELMLPGLASKPVRVLAG